MADEHKPFQYITLIITVLIVSAPVIFLLLGSFSKADLPGDFSFSELTLANYSAVYLEKGTYDLIYNTVLYVVGCVFFGTSLAFLLAWLVARTNIPGKELIYGCIPLTLATPPMVQAMAWILLLSPRMGFANQILIDVFGLSGPPLNIYSLPGMIFVEGMRQVPVSFLMLVPLFRAMDPTLEEAAAVSGGGAFSSFRRISIPLLMPGLIAAMIYQTITALEVFEIPALLGLPSKIYVFSTKLYALVEMGPYLPTYGEASALAMAYLLAAMVGIGLYARVIGHEERYAVITGKGYRPRPIDLGKWRPAAVVFVFMVPFLSVGLPFFVLLYTSLIKYLRPLSLSSILEFSLGNYRALITNPDVYVATRNTVVMGFAAATMTSGLSFLVSLVVIRSRFRFRKLLDQVAFAPHAIPGIMMGLALLSLFGAIKDVVPIYGTIWAMAVGFGIKFMGYGTRSFNSALLQIHRELEEASYACGASPLQTIRKIFLPLILPTFAGVWIFVVLLSSRIAGMPLILYQGPQNQVLGILMWNMWQQKGGIQQAAGLSVLLMTAFWGITITARVFGFRAQVTTAGAS